MTEGITEAALKVVSLKGIVECGGREAGNIWGGSRRRAFTSSSGFILLSSVIWNTPTVLTRLKQHGISTRSTFN
ncbi:unnamed protein product [Pleuronectes platessa]|uniref:Uncharacterized protein n=1 Tax=Pleuronectes platessa TaxID=8262 RepID=A0A9N7YVK2_PLEPL|nr:unnamed protein product [Pleuronectes platessa]